MNYLATRMGLLAVLFAVGCSGPMGPIPGGMLKGDRGTLSSDWSFAKTADHIQLETLDIEGEPHSVNIWAGVVDGRLFVPTSLVRGAQEPSERAWVRNALSNPTVRVRIDGLLYPGVISRVSEPALLDRVKEKIIQKYAGEPDARSAKAWIFEIREPPDGKSE